MEWAKLSDHLDYYKYKVSLYAKDGHCFVTSIHKCLLYDHGEMFSDHTIKDFIKSEIAVNKHYYSNYFDGE